MSQELALRGDSSVPQELIKCRSAIDGALERYPHEVRLAMEKFEKAALHMVSLPKQNFTTSPVDLPTKIPEKFFKLKDARTRALDFTEQEWVSEEDYVTAGILFPSAKPLSRAEVKQLQVVFDTLMNDLGKFGLTSRNEALSLDQLSDYANNIMGLHASTDIIFEELRRQALARSQRKFKDLTKVKNIYQNMLKTLASCVTEFGSCWQTEREKTRSVALQVLKRQTQLEYVVRELTHSESLIAQIARAAEEKSKTLKEEVFVDELENDHLVRLHSLYRAREERVNAETQASTRKLQKYFTGLLSMAGRLSSENCVTAVNKVLNTRLAWSFRWKDLQSLSQSLTSLHLAKLVIDTESIFTTLELIQVQMEKVVNYILNSVVTLRNLQRTQMREDANDEATGRSSETNVKAIKIALECERQLLVCFKIDTNHVLQAIGSPLEAVFSTSAVDSIYANTSVTQASIYQHLEQSGQRTFGAELLLEEVKLVTLQCTAVLKRINSLVGVDVQDLTADAGLEFTSEPVSDEEQQLHREPTTLEAYSLSLFQTIDFVSESVHRKKQLCEDFQEFVDLLGETVPGNSTDDTESSQRSPLSGSETASRTAASPEEISSALQVLVDKLREERNMRVSRAMQEMISIRQLLQKLSIDLASTRLQRAKVFVQVDQDLVSWVFAVLLKLCKVDESSAIRLTEDINKLPENLDENTLHQVRPGCFYENNSTEWMAFQPAANFREDKHTDPLPRLRSHADVVNCSNQLIERVSQLDGVIARYSACFVGEKELADAIQLLRDGETDLVESMEQLVFLTEREGRIAGEVQEEESETPETVDEEENEDGELAHILASTSLGPQDTPCHAVIEFAQEQIRQKKTSLENLQTKISTTQLNIQQERQRLDDVKSQLDNRRSKLRELTDILLGKQLTLFEQSVSN
nr:unnamed protein product [Spirometra erinaceieuropaei]